jgi:hypothetical protein
MPQTEHLITLSRPRIEYSRCIPSIANERDGRTMASATETATTEITVSELDVEAV